MANLGTTVRLNGNAFEVVPRSWQVSELVPVPAPMREGATAFADRQDDSAYTQRDWSDGYGQVTHPSPSAPTRFADSRNVLTDVPGLGVVLSFEHQVVTGMDEAPTKVTQLTVAGRMAALSATKVWLRQAAADVMDSKLSGVTPKDIIAWGDGANTLYLVAMGSGAAYRYTTDITASPPTWVTSALSGDDAKADFWAMGPKGTGTSGGTLWKALKPNKVYATDDPKNATGHWTSPYLVGSSATEITSFRIFDGRLLVGKPEGLFQIKPDGTVEPIIELAGALDGNNCMAMESWGSYLFVPWLQGLFLYKGNYLLNLAEVTASFRDVGPGINSGSGSDVRGRVLAMCHAPTRLYAVLASESGNYNVLRYNGNPTPGYGWAPFLALDANACAALGWEQPASGNPRLYFGYGAGLRYVIMPRSGDNPLLDSGCRFASSGWVESAEYESPLPMMAKAYTYEALDLERVGAGGRYVDVSYSVDGAAWGALMRVEAEGLSNIYYSTNTTGRRIKRRHTLGTGENTNTPRLRLAELHWEPRPPARKRWSFQVIVAAGTASNPTRTASKAKGLLEAARNSVAPVGFTDRLGDSWDVFVEQVGEVEVAKIPGTAESVFVISVAAKEFRSGLGVFYYDDENALYGSATYA